MNNSISVSSPVPAAETIPPPATAQKGSPVPQTQEPADTNAAPKDTVQLSAAAQTALREATETPAQTAKEAGQGDSQAKHLLAKQKAEKALAAPKIHVVA